MQEEQKLVARTQRLPGVRSSFAALETLMGKDEDFGYEDFLNGMVKARLFFCYSATEPEEEQQFDVHSVMEEKYGLGVCKLHLNV
jgi:hypothetical protein